MEHIIFFEHLFESVPDYTKFLLFMFLIQNYVDLLPERGFLRNDIVRLCKEFKKY